MPGYATTGATIDGQAGTAFARNVGTSEVTIFTATVKTRLNICTVTNQIKTTLPIRIYIKDVSGNTYDVVRNLRVTNQIIAWHYLVQPSSPVCLLYTSPSPRDRQKSRMPSSA